MSLIYNVGLKIKAGFLLNPLLAARLAAIACYTPFAIQSYTSGVCDKKSRSLRSNPN